MSDTDYLARVTRRFIVGESFDPPTIKTYIQSLEEIIGSLQPKTVKEQNKIKIAKQHIREVRRYARRLEEKISILEEQVTVLEEKKEK